MNQLPDRSAGPTIESRHPLTRVVLDANVWDSLALFKEVQDRIRVLCIAGEMTIVMPDTLHRELKESPFQGIPDWFPVRIVSDSVFVLDHSVLNHARLGEGEIYREHLGESKQRNDAIIVDAADSDADIFVSEDRRARKRYAAIRGSEKSLDFSAFCIKFLGLEIKATDPTEE